MTWFCPNQYSQKHKHYLLNSKQKRQPCRLLVQPTTFRVPTNITHTFMLSNPRFLCWHFKHRQQITSPPSADMICGSPCNCRPSGTDTKLRLTIVAKGRPLSKHDARCGGFWRPVTLTFELFNWNWQCVYPCNWERVNPLILIFLLFFCFFSYEPYRTDRRMGKTRNVAYNRWRPHNKLHSDNDNLLQLTANKWY